MPLHALKTFAKRLMPHRRKRTGDYVPPRRYKITLENMSSLQPLAEMRGRKYSLVIFTIVCFLVIGAIWLAIFIYTPMRNILPMRLQSDLRQDYVELSQRIDSANETMRINMQYFTDVMSIINDERPHQINARPEQLATPLPVDSLLESSNAERSFATRFENAERFNVSVLAPIAAEAMTFYPPISGIETIGRTSDQGIPYAVAAPGKSTPISAAYRGTVINSYYTTSRGLSLVVQHPNDFISIYSGLADTFVSRGDKVTSGQRLGIAREGSFPFVFELWHNGAPLAPKDFIIF